MENRTQSPDLQKLAAGDHSVYKDLFMEYFPKVKYFIAHFIKNEAIAEELTQELFVKIWINRKKLSSIDLLGAYIYKMARNISLDYIAKKGKEELFIGKYTVDTTYTIEEDFYAEETALLISLTVAIMPEQRKKVYEMSRVTGMSNEEIAMQLDLSKKTVENHLNLALKEIRKALSLLSLFF